MNVITGVKEAKLNDPTEEIPELSGLPVDSSVVVVDPEPAPEPAERPLPKGAPAYENAGKIKKPMDESSTFYDSLDVLKESVGQKAVAQAKFIEAIETLRELSHDIYYGLQLTKDTEAVKALFCLVGGAAVRTAPAAAADNDGDKSGSSRLSSLAVVRDAASILSAAVQNNPKALDEIAKAWPAIAKFKCTTGGRGTVEENLTRALTKLFVNGDDLSDTDHREEAARVKATVSAINGLLRSETIRDSLLSNGLMSELLHVLGRPHGADSGSVDGAWDATHARVGQLVMDNFLDEAMGAVTGVWPTVASQDHAGCRKILDENDAKVKDGSAGKLKDAEGCWDYRVSEIAKRFDDDVDHWTADFLRLLRERQALDGSSTDGKRERVVDEL